MDYNVEDLKKIVELYKDKIIKKRIANIVLVNSRCFLFYLVKSQNQIIIDLDNMNPYFGVISTSYNELSLPNDFVAKCVSCGHPIIDNIEVINNDRIIKITSVATDAYYHRNTYNLYIELFRTRANMILTNKDDTIITAFHETNAQIGHMILKGFKYQLPANNLTYNSKNFTIENYDKFLNDNFKNVLAKRKNELYGNYILKEKKQINAINRKIEAVKESIEKAYKNEIYKDYGQRILMNIHNIKKGMEFYEDIKLNSILTPSENAEYYFNKYKKAKRTITIATDVLEGLKNELEKHQYLYETMQLSDSDNIKLLLPPKQNKNNKTIINAYLPYQIKYKNTFYYFGKNAIENDYLTFKLFRKSNHVTWLHLKDSESAHVIINKLDPNKDELLFACSLLLIVSKKNAGEIMYTSRDNITRGNGIAKAIVETYKTIKLNNVNDDVRKVIDDAKRCSE